MTWHIDPVMLERYCRGDLGEASVMSAEAHLLACADCRSALTPGVDADALERMWLGVRDAMDAPRARILERVLVRLGVRGDMARLIALTPTFRRAWMVSILLTLAFVVLVSHVLGFGNQPFLVIAPIVPVAGVAWSFGRRGDPLWEIARGTPTGGSRLVLIRSTAVLGVSMILTAGASIALPRFGWMAFAWLLPAFALTLLTLALSTARIATESAAAAVGAVWVLVVGSARWGSGSPFVFRPGGQLAVGMLALICVFALVLRRDMFDRVVVTEGAWR